VASMRFMSCSKDPRKSPKVMEFDSSPGRAIAQLLGAGIWDERSYRAELMEDRGDEQVYEIHMTRLKTAYDPSDHQPQKVGLLTYHRPEGSPPRSFEQSALAR
jgi:hypothetical protein